MCMFIPFGKIDIYFKWKSYFCGLDAPIKVVCSIVSMMMVTFMAIDRLMVSNFIVENGTGDTATPNYNGFCSRFQR